VPLNVVFRVDSPAKAKASVFLKLRLLLFGGSLRRLARDLDESW
jgi:hypothetical protein